MLDCFAALSVSGDKMYLGFEVQELVFKHLADQPISRLADQPIADSR